MVKLTLELIARSTSRHTRRKKDENVHQFVHRLTHLYLENKHIHDAGEDLVLCHNLIVLYMYDNQLTHIPKLSCSSSLTHLYLQNNKISKIENLTVLVQLQKIFLGGNLITVLEGLENLKQLQELHVENQCLPQGEHLLFDPRSLQGISEKLSRLTQLMVINNQLDDMKELAQLLSSWQHLWRLDLTGNPLCQKPKYKDQIIVMANHLEVLDGKTITQTERQFLVSWQAIRDLHLKRSQDNLLRQDTFASVSAEMAGGQNLPPVGQRQAGLSAPALPGMQHRQYGDVLEKFSSLDPSRARKAQSGISRT
ncbi:unnamed protein product, partial [Candidula unifasciata]